MTPFIALPLAMLESPAYQVLSLLERRFLDRLQIEHLRPGGKENGRLIVTYDQFEQWGITRNYVMAAQRVVCDLGLVEVTQKGQGGPKRRPNKYRLTFDHMGYVPATHEWRTVRTLDEAEAITQKARSGAPKNGTRKNRILAPKLSTPLVDKMSTPLPPSPVYKMSTPF